MLTFVTEFQIKALLQRHFKLEKIRINLLLFVKTKLDLSEKSVSISFFLFLKYTWVINNFASFIVLLHYITSRFITLIIFQI